jgi:putative ABC transport system ATP-binding protein
VLALKGIRKSFRAPGGDALDVLTECDLSIKPGDSIAILGRSGSGKSTLLSLVGLLERADGGEYVFDGINVRDLSDSAAAHVRGERLGFVFQRSFLLPSLSAAENVEVPLLHAKRLDSQRIRRRLVAEALELAGIGHRARHRPRELSGGEQQLTALARALVRRPSYLLADEPTGNLDPVTGDRVVAAMAALAKERDVAVLMVTHDHNLASIFSRRYLLDLGRLREVA